MFTIHPEKAIIAMNVIKMAILADYNHHMGHVDNADRMANSYTASLRMLKWKKAVFPPVRLGDCQHLRPYYLRVVGTKFNTDFPQTLIREILVRSGHESGPSMLLGTSEEWT
jgi:hypothetical protein